MAHWFHRNPIKASLPIDFDKRSYPTSSDARMICSMLKQSRSNLLSFFSDPANSSEKVMEELKTYVSLLLGFMTDMSGKSTNGDSKLRYSIKSKWTQSLGSQFSHEEQDTIYEMSCMLVNAAIWLTKHGAYVAAITSEPSDKEAKETHKSFRQAAGFFKFVQDNLTGKLLKNTSTANAQPFADLTDLILATYINQCKAEAQEITIARAIEMKHTPSLIASIAQSTSTLFQAASDSLSSIDKTIGEKWSRYLALKARFYKSQAYCYHGQDLLSQDKCGDAIKCLQQSKKLYQETEQLCKEYANTKGPGTQAIPERHQFFKNLGIVIDRVTEKCERENGMIYHQKLPVETPIYETSAVHGLAEPEEYTFPKPHEHWTPANYDAFNLSKAMDEKEIKKTTSEKSLVVPPIKENPIPQAGAEKINSISGCNIS